MHELFPSLYEAKRLEEVVLFTVGLMTDPSAVVNYVYQLHYDRMTKMLLIGKHDTDIEGKLKREGKNINNIEVYETFYKESAVELPGTALHNQHINFYSGIDVSPVYLPSKQFVFRSPKLNPGFTIPDPQHVHFQRDVSDSVILFTHTDDALANSILNNIRKISQLQPIGHLVISDIKCEDIEDVDVFNMSKKSKSIHLLNCIIPAATIDHLLQQIATSSTITRINIRGTSLQGIRSLAIQYLPSLTFLRLSNTNLCRFHILHLGYLIANKKLPKLGILNIGRNNLNHLQYDLSVFLQTVATQHHKCITVGIQHCCLSMEFFQRMKEYTVSSFLSIVGDKEIPVEKSQEVVCNSYRKTQQSWKTEQPLQVASLRDCLPQHISGPILKTLASHGHIMNLDLSGNNLGIYGHYLVSTIMTWGPESDLRELDLSNCSLPVEVCGPLLSVLGICRNLTELWLPGNTLTGCLQNFLADPDSRLPSLQELFLNYTKLNAHDLLHLDQLIQAEKMPQLRELDLGANGLHKMLDHLTNWCRY